MAGEGLEGWEMKPLPAGAAEVAEAKVVKGRGRTGEGTLRFEVSGKEGVSRRLGRQEV